MIVAGAVWGSAGFLLFPADHPQHVMFLIFVLAGMTAGGVVSFSADLISAVAFSVLLSLPIAIRLFVAGDSLSVTMGMAVMLYLGFMIMSMRRINRHVNENIALRIEAAAREEKMRESEERYRLLLSHLPVGIFHYDTDLVITYCNDRCAGMLRNSVDCIIGLDMKLVRDQAILPSLRKALQGEMAYYEGHYLATYSEAEGWIYMTCAPSRDGQRKDRRRHRDRSGHHRAQGRRRTGSRIWRSTIRSPTCPTGGCCWTGCSRHWRPARAAAGKARCCSSTWTISRR